MMNIMLAALWIGGWTTAIVAFSEWERVPYAARFGACFAAIVFAWTGGWRLFL